MPARRPARARKIRRQRQLRGRLMAARRKRGFLRGRRLAQLAKVFRTARRRARRRR